MAELIVVHGSDPRRLLEEAAEEFLVPPRASGTDPFPSPSCLLVLRQGGLREDLIRLAAERGVPGWLHEPLCIFQQLPERLGHTARQPCDDFERATILTALIRQGGRGPLGRLRNPEAFVGAVDRLFGELIGEGVSAERFGAALAGGAARPEFESSRDAELSALYRDYLTLLQGEGRRDGRDTLLDVANAIADGAALATRLRLRREIRILGLQDLRGGWRALLHALCASPALDRILLYAAEPLDLGPELPVTVRPLVAGHPVAERLFGAEAPAEPVGSVDAIVAPDAERELEEVARRIRTLAEQGTPLHRIGIVARQARPYLDLALHALERFGIPATARRRVALVEVPIIRALRSLFAAAADGWSRHGLVELAEQPYFANGLDPQLLNHAGHRRRILGLTDWQAALDGLAEAATLAESREEEDAGEGRRLGLPRAERAVTGAASFAQFRALAADLDDVRTLAEWTAWLVEFLDRDPWGAVPRMQRIPTGRHDVVRLDLAAWRGVRDSAARWRQALARWGDTAPMTIGDFRLRVEGLLDADVAIWTPSLEGVQVFEGLAAAYRPFDHLFLVGLTAGRWPLPAPRSPILDDAERVELAGRGLPLESDATWDRLERGLFRVLVAGAERRLTVSWSQLDPAGRESVNSAYVEALGDVATLLGAGEDDAIPTDRVVTPGIRLYQDAEALVRARHGARIETLRQTGAPSPWNGQIEDPALLAWLAREVGDRRLWSPTQLEALAKCPWAWFSGRLLRLATVADPDESLDAATRGTLLHRTLARFFQRAGERLGAPVRLQPDDLAWALPLLEETVAAVLEEARTEGTWLGHPALLPARQGELSRLLGGYLRWEAQEHHDEEFSTRARNAPRRIRTGVTGHEVGFTDQVLEIGGIRIRFRGSVDRIERGLDDRAGIGNAGRFIVAVDYKSSTSSVPGAGKPAAWEDGVVLQVPLYAWALAQLEPGAEVARVEYRSLKQRESVHQLQLVSYDRKTKAVLTEPSQVERYQAALEAVATHVKGARAGTFPATPAPSCGCPPFCHALDICRIAGGPVRAGRP